MDIALDDLNSDIDLLDGDLYFVDEVAAVAQHVRQRLKLFLGEWFLDESVGIPYFDSIFLKNPDLNLVDSLLKNAVLLSPGIIALTNFSLALDTFTRKLSVSVEALAKDGPIEFTEVIGV